MGPPLCKFDFERDKGLLFDDDDNGVSSLEEIITEANKWGVCEMDG